MDSAEAVMIQESEIVPYHISHPPGERILVLAPHPDDETFGCGGAILLHIRAEKKVRVVFLTSGDRGDPTCDVSATIRWPGLSEGTCVTAYSLMREKEAKRALGVLGVSDYEFWRFPDRAVHEHYREALQRISKTVEEFSPDTIYVPSMVEVNPDHRAAAALSLEIQRRYHGSYAGSDSQASMRLVFYEVTTPLRPNLLVDITPVYRTKKRALKRYRSQLRLADYLGHIVALNTVRALTVNGPRYVEGFWSLERPIGEKEIADWLSYRKVLNASY